MTRPDLPGVRGRRAPDCSVYVAIAALCVAEAITLYFVLRAFS